MLDDLRVRVFEAHVIHRKARGNGAVCQGCDEPIWGTKHGWYVVIEGDGREYPIIGSRLCSGCNSLFRRYMAMPRGA